MLNVAHSIANKLCNFTPQLHPVWAVVFRK